MNDRIEFLTTTEYNSEDIRKVQKILLTMADYVHNILESHNIKYYITFGTLLGAVRHGGFVPWDDDIDLFLFDEEYDYALECLRNELPSWMIVHDEKVDSIYWPYWSRIRDLNSEAHAEMFPDDNCYKFKGINLDLYRLKKTKRSLAELAILRENLSFFERKHAVGMLTEDIYVAKTEEITSKINSYVPKVEGIDEDVYYFVFLTKIIEQKHVLPLKKYQFEGREFWGPNDAHALLTQAYGDYMQIPEYSKRKAHYSKVTYKDNYFDYLNEK